MKFRMILASAAIASIGFGTPVFAQSSAALTETQLQDYIRTHPEVQRDPSLFDNPAYLREHPTLARFLETHPDARAQVMRMGDYDSGHHWRDADWWHQHDPNWVEAHHPEWNQSHPAWAKEGAYDSDHHWQNREWWVHNNPTWVKEHHPKWAEAHPAGAPVHEVDAPAPVHEGVAPAHVANEPHPHHHVHPNVPPNAPYNGHPNG